MAERAFGKKIDTWRMRQGRKDFEIEVRMSVGAPEPFMAVHKAAGIEIRSADINKLQERVRAKLEENERAGEPEIVWTLYWHVEVRLDVDQSDGFGCSAGCSVETRPVEIGQQGKRRFYRWKHNPVIREGMLDVGVESDDRTTCLVPVNDKTTEGLARLQGAVSTLGGHLLKAVNPETVQQNLVDLALMEGVPNFTGEAVT